MTDLPEGFVPHFKDMLRRYFVANQCPIISVQYHSTLCRSKFLPIQGGNFKGFYWGKWQVMWRIPYSSCWGFDGVHWRPNHHPTPKQEG